MRGDAADYSLEGGNFCAEGDGFELDRFDRWFTAETSAGDAHGPTVLDVPRKRRRPDTRVCDVNVRHPDAGPSSDGQGDLRC
jgi:hypothetical protein